jgi:hypothetical protein
MTWDIDKNVEPGQTLIDYVKFGQTGYRDLTANVHSFIVGEGGEDLVIERITIGSQSQNVLPFPLVALRSEFDGLMPPHIKLDPVWNGGEIEFRVSNPTTQLRRFRLRVLWHFLSFPRRSR